MIFVTVGAQMPFRRLVNAVDDWAATSGVDVLAQIGTQAEPPTHIRWQRFMEPDEFSEAIDSCDLIVAHAGMGSIIAALTRGKPLVVMPRQGARRETRNDHQMATAERFGTRPGIEVADDDTALAAILDAGRHAAPERVSTEATPELTTAIADFISSSPPRSLRAAFGRR